MGNFQTSSPNEAIIKSSFKGSQVHVGQTVFKYWCIQHIERLSLELMTIHIDSIGAETVHGVRVQVKAVAQVKVRAFEVPALPGGDADDDGSAGLEAAASAASAAQAAMSTKRKKKKNRRGEKRELDEGSILLAAQHFLGDDEEAIRQAIQRTLEGHQRQILGTLTVEELYKNREVFSARVKQVVLGDLNAMGYGLASYVVQSIDDSNDYMVSLGVTQTAAVKREAAVGRAKNEAEARKSVALYMADAQTAEAEQEQRARVAVNQQKEIESESDRDLNLKKAAFESQVNQARAEAAGAGPIEEARQQQAIVREKTKQQQVEESIKLEIADQIVERTKKEKEGNALANLLEERNNALAVEVMAKANAEKTRALGEAEADVVRFKGQAEASVLQNKAEAYKQFGEAAVVQMIVEQLPALAKEISAPLTQTEKITFISSGGEGGSGGGPSQFTADVSKMIAMVPDAVEGITGFSMTDAVKQLTSQTVANSKADADAAKAKKHANNFETETHL